MNLPKITLLNRMDAVQYKPKGKAVAVRLDDQYPLRDLKGSYLDVLVQTFKDTEDISDYSITNDNAKDIVEFVKKHSKIDEIVVHCHHRQGRSPAVALAIEEHFKIKNIDIREFPNINKLVLSKVRSAFKGELRAENTVGGIKESKNEKEVSAPEKLSFIEIIKSMFS